MKEINCLISYFIKQNSPDDILLVGASIGGSNVHLAVEVVRLLVLLLRLRRLLVVVVVMMVGPAAHRRGAGAVLVRAVLGDVVKGGGRSRAA